MMRSWYHAIPRHIGRRQRLRHVSILSVRYRRRRNEENSQRHCGCSKPRTLMKPTYNRNGERQCWCDPCAEFGCSTRLYRGRFSLGKYVGAGALDLDEATSARARVARTDMRRKAPEWGAYGEELMGLDLGDAFEATLSTQTRDAIKAAPPAFLLASRPVFPFVFVLLA